MKRYLCLLVAFTLVLAFASTALATGETLSHSGTSTYGYYTNDYFDQKNDKNIHCLSAYCSYPMKVVPVIHQNGTWVELTSRMNFDEGHLFVLLTSPTVRRVHLYLINTISTSTQSSGYWELRP